MATRRSHGEGTIYFNRERDRWEGKIDLPSDVPGKRTRRKATGKTKAEVRDKLFDLRSKAKDGVPTGDGNDTVNRLLDRWLTTGLPARSTVKSSNTVASYQWAISHIRTTIGTKRLRTLSPEDVELMLSGLARAGMARNSVMRVRSVLLMALKWAQRRGDVVRNVADLAEMPADARAPEDGRSLSAEQAAQLLSVAAGHRLGALVTVGLMLGLRPGELLGLRWRDIDFETAVLSIEQSVKRVYVNGRERLVFGEPKTKKSRRALDMPAPVVAALVRHRKAQATARLAAGSAWTDHDLVFPTTVGTPMSPSNLRREFSALTTAAGLGHWHPNELRHSAGSLLSAAGVPLEEIADLLGHTNTKTLEKHYRHPVRRSVKAAAAPMEKMFGSSA